MVNGTDRKMKVVILAGGLGTRLSEETGTRPKPMVEIGGKPILWHIMKIYSHFGFHDFVVCLGYKGYMIKEYFSNYFLHMSDVTFDMQTNAMEVHERFAEPWRVTLVETGSDTMTGGRLKRVARYVREAPFMMTYGDGLADVNIPELMEFHRRQRVQATVTVVQPMGRFGVVRFSPEDSEKVASFQEKPVGDGSWISGGFFVLEPGVLDCIQDDRTIFEREPLEGLAAQGRLSSYRHSGFWHAMDTLRDRNRLDELWNTGKAPWKVWK